jgi:hypothetical protein
MRGIRCGAWGELLLMGKEVEAVAGRLKHTHSCGQNEHAGIMVSRKNKSQ